MDNQRILSERITVSQARMAGAILQVLIAGAIAGRMPVDRPGAGTYSAVIAVVFYDLVLIIYFVLSHTRANKNALSREFFRYCFLAGLVVAFFWNASAIFKIPGFALMLGLFGCIFRGCTF